MAGRGRPSKGVERSNILLRIPTDLIEQVDAFKESLEAERGGFVINRTDMLIRLIEVGLQTLTQARQPTPHPAHQPMTQPAPASRVNGQAPAEPVPDRAHDDHTVVQEKVAQPRGRRSGTGSHARSCRRLPMNARTVKGSPCGNSLSVSMRRASILRQPRTAAVYRPIQATSQSGWSRHGQ
jgi:hypothetical protein